MLDQQIRRQIHLGLRDVGGEEAVAEQRQFQRPAILGAQRGPTAQPDFPVPGNAPAVQRDLIVIHADRIRIETADLDAQARHAETGIEQGAVHLQSRRPGGACQSQRRIQPATQVGHVALYRLQCADVAQIEGDLPGQRQLRQPVEHHRAVHGQVGAQGRERRIFGHQPRFGPTPGYQSAQKKGLRAKTQGRLARLTFK